MLVLQSAILQPPAWLYAWLQQPDVRPELSCLSMFKSTKHMLGLLHRLVLTRGLYYLHVLLHGGVLTLVLCCMSIQQLMIPPPHSNPTCAPHPTNTPPTQSIDHLQLRSSSGLQVGSDPNYRTRARARAKARTRAKTRTRARATPTTSEGRGRGGSHWGPPPPHPLTT